MILDSAATTILQKNDRYGDNLRRRRRCEVREVPTCAGMNGGTSRGASGEEVVRRVNTENDLEATCKDAGEKQKKRRTEGGSEQK